MWGSFVDGRWKWNKWNEIKWKKKNNNKPFCSHQSAARWMTLSHFITHRANLTIYAMMNDRYWHRWVITIVTSTRGNITSCWGLFVFAASIIVLGSIEKWLWSVDTAIFMDRFDQFYLFFAPMSMIWNLSNIMPCIMDCLLSNSGTS